LIHEYDESEGMLHILLFVRCFDVISKRRDIWDNSTDRFESVIENSIVDDRRKVWYLPEEIADDFHVGRHLPRKLIINYL
jgi:hypothetical protein